MKKSTSAVSLIPLEERFDEEIGSSWYNTNPKKRNKRRTNNETTTAMELSSFSGTLGFIQVTTTNDVEERVMVIGGDAGVSSPQWPKTAGGSGWAKLPDEAAVAKSTSAFSPADTTSWQTMLGLNMLWLVVAVAYMCPFTSLGSLIEYFTAKYGANFYVKLYCAFYLPGWPVAELQRRYDEGYDMKFGTTVAYFTRVAVGLVLQALLLALFPAIPSMTGSPDGEKTVILLFMVLMGIGSWMAHGTACQLCAMFPGTSTAFLQVCA